MIDQVVFEINNYEQTIINSKWPLRRNSILSKWHPVNAFKMKKFRSLVLLMGLIRLLTYQHYWSKKPLFGLPYFSEFQAILRFWQFGDYPESTDDRLSNICLMVNTFIKKCYDVLVPDKNLSLDESMMLWLERIVLKQYIKNKRHNYEIKFFELTARGLPELKQTTNQHRKELVKSNVITDYNANMSGIDQPDQMLSCHSSLRKTVRWYKKVGGSHTEDPSDKCSLHLFKLFRRS